MRRKSTKISARSWTRLLKLMHNPNFDIPILQLCSVLGGRDDPREKQEAGRRGKDPLHSAFALKDSCGHINMINMIKIIDIKLVSKIMIRCIANWIQPYLSTDLLVMHQLFVDKLICLIFTFIDWLCFPALQLTTHVSAGASLSSRKNWNNHYVSRGLFGQLKMRWWPLNKKK